MSDIETELARLKASNARIKKNIANAYSNIEEKGGTVPTEQTSANLASTITEIPTAKKEFTGHCDAEGLAAIGWTEDDIKYFQDNGVVWDEKYDDVFKLDDDELAGTSLKTCRFGPSNYNRLTYMSNKYLIGVPSVDTNTFSDPTDIRYAFAGTSLSIAPQLNTSNIQYFQEMFNGCYPLLKVPDYDFSSAINLSSMFKGCSSLSGKVTITAPNATDASNLFYGCSALTSIELTLPKVTSVTTMINGCTALREFSLDAPSLTSFSYSDISLGKVIAVSKYNIPSRTTIAANTSSSIFSYMYALRSFPEMDCSNVKSMYIPFPDSSYLMYLGGFKNLGKGYTGQSTMVQNEGLYLSANEKLTHDSLMNVINDLYTLTYTQSLGLGDTNIAKLTADEIAIATAKNWTVS